MVKTNELAVIAEQNQLSNDKVQVLLSNFGEDYKLAEDIAKNAGEIVVTSENQTKLMSDARRKRLELKNIRVSVEKTRKELKEESLREGKAIDGMANIIKALIVPVELHLEKQEKFAENLAAERHQKLLVERELELAKYTDNPSMYNFGDMVQDAFDNLIDTLKKAKLEQEEAEKKAEQERIKKAEDEAKEQERIRRENEKLKADAAAREVELEKERKRLAEEQKVIEAENAKKLAAERAKLDEERKKREAIEAEAKAKSDLEAKERAAKEESDRQALLAPDKEKLLAFATVIDSLTLPNVANREAGKLLDETQDFLNRISKNLRNKAKEL